MSYPFSIRLKASRSDLTLGGDYELDVREKERKRVKNKIESCSKKDSLLYRKKVMEINTKKNMSELIDLIENSIKH